MKAYKKNFLIELKYAHYMKIPIILTLALMSVYCLGLFNQYQKYNQLNEIFERTSKEIISNGENIEDLLKGDYVIEEQDVGNGNSIVHIDNALKYDYEQLKNHHEKIQPGKITVEILKDTSLVFFPIISCILAIYIATYNFSDDTLKSRMQNGTSLNIFISKLLSFVTLFTIAFIASAMIATVSGFFTSTYFLNNSMGPFKNISYNMDYIILIRTLSISYEISIYYAFIFYGISFIVKNFSLVSLLFLMSHLMIPNLGKYDIKNLFINIYSLKGNIAIPIKYTPMIMGETYLLISLITLSILGIAYYVFKRTGKYKVRLFN